MRNILKKLIFISICFSLMGFERSSKPEPIPVHKKLSKFDRLRRLISSLPRTKIVDSYENTKKKKD
ncbi:TPA: hypothetical protein DIC20_04030 [Candidatus Dependentiae bacterium]|nr:hypothetical protein [Candidatus Dependentiae bacterium]HCU00846.1 hypothetical protein [Candidatus Dependentiae bacterium]